MKKLFVAGLLLVAFGWAQQRPRLLGISHISVRVKDLNASRVFYTGLMGFQEAYTIRKDGTVTSGGGLSQDQVSAVYFKVNNRQSIVLMAENSPDQSRYVEAGIETDDAEAMRVWLKSLGYAVPDKVERNAVHDIAFHVKDPGGNSYEITQYTPQSLSVVNVGKYLGPDRPSERILHVGVSVRVRESLDFYFKGFALHEVWRSDRTMSAPGAAPKKAAPTNGPLLAGTTNSKLPDSDDYIEFGAGNLPPAAQAAGSGNTKKGGRGGAGGGGGHIALYVLNMDKAVALVKAKPAWKDYPRAAQTEAHVGVNHKWQGNFFDPDGTRTEFMEPDTADGLPVPMSKAPYY